MRLLNIHRYRFRKGGAEAVYLDHIQLFSSRGWACSEFVMAHPKNSASVWSEYFPTYFDPEAASPGNISNISRFIYSHEAKARIEKVLDDFQPDIVHVHGVYHQLTPSVLGPIAKRKIPVVYTAHDFKLLCPAYTLFTEKLGVCERCAGGNTIHCALNRCIHESYAASLVYAADGAYHRIRGSYRKTVSAYVMPSKFILAKHREYGFPANKLHYIPNFFETTDDEPVDVEQLQEHRARFGKYVLYFGRLSSEKGVDKLIEACSAANLTLVVLGDGPDAAKLQTLSMRMKTPTIFLGHLTGSTLWTFVEGALCTAIPSVWYENAPKSVLEAQSRGQIVVASDIGGLPELIEDESTGYLVPPGDVVGLSRTLAKIAKMDDAARMKMGNAARRSVSDEFKRERYYSRMVALYETLIGSAPMGTATTNVFQSS